MAANIFIHNKLGKVPGLYYDRCPQDTFNGEYIKTKGHSSFKSFADLVDKLAAHHAKYHVIVTHGHPDGISMPFAGKSDIPGDAASFIELMKAVSDAAAIYRVKGTQKPISVAGVSEKDVLHVAKSAAKIKPSTIVVRGCDIGRNERTLRALGRALNAEAIEAPTLEQVYVTVRPYHESLETIGSKAATSRNQKNMMFKLAFGFEESLGFNPPGASKILLRNMRGAGAILIEVDYPFPNPRDPTDTNYASSQAWATKNRAASAWGNVLNHRWDAAPSGPDSTSFALKALMDKEKLLLHLPVDSDYLAHHRTLTSL